MTLIAETRPAVELTRLRTLRTRVRNVLTMFPEEAVNRQVHPMLSPAAWHVGHTHFVESLWLRERVLGDSADLADHASLYLPERCPKTERGTRLPSIDRLLTWCDDMSAAADSAWELAYARRQRHGMIGDHYLLGFLIQHYAQHLETLRMAQQAWAIAEPTPDATGHPLRSRAADFTWLSTPEQSLEPGHAPGCAAPYDNELGAHRVRMPAFQIATRPVSNGQWLAFMESGGYERAEWWTASGWSWRQSLQTPWPMHWRGDRGDWVAVQPDGSAAPPEPDAPVYGISQHEALAFATWAGARLPHELEWLAARPQLDQVGEVWEWCDNALYPFPGFRPFPYPEYTLPWCDGRHAVLKGGSRWTEPDIRRDSFRNFYTPDMRHIFAGLRLARSETDLPANCADRRTSTE